MKRLKIEFDPDEFLARTAILSPAELGVYCRICELMSNRGGPIDIDKLRRRCSGTRSVLNAILNRLMANGFIVRDGDKIWLVRRDEALSLKSFMERVM